MQMTIKDFCILLIATFKLNGISSFDINRIPSEIGIFSNNKKTNMLFDKLSVGEFNEVIGMKQYLWGMLLSGYNYFKNIGTKWEIIIDEKIAEQIINRYSIENQKMMSFLVEEYKNNKCQNIKKKI